MNASSSARLEVTTVRGIACLALVAYHVVGPSAETGMHLREASAWHYAMNSLDFVRMPLFTVLSGFLYARCRVERSSLGSFFSKKLLRLAVPLLFVTAVMVELRRHAYGDPTSFTHAILFHYQHLWFLQSLILVFLCIALTDSFARLSTSGLCVAALTAAAASGAIQITELLSLNGALYLAPFFLFGMILREEPDLLRKQSALSIALATAAIVMLAQQACLLGFGPLLSRVSLPAFLCGCSAAYLLLVLCPRIAIFEAIGGYSYTIYLWHSMSAATVRSVVERHLSLSVGSEFILLVTAALAVPIVIHVGAARLPIACTLLTGLRKPEQPLLPSLISAPWRLARLCQTRSGRTPSLHIAGIARGAK